MRRSFKEEFLSFFVVFSLRFDRQTDEKKMYFESFNNRNTTETTNPSFSVFFRQTKERKRVYENFFFWITHRDIS